MSRDYWLDLFTGKTWEEFLEHGADITGFRERRKNISQKILPGDYFLCYLTGISRFVGVLEVKSRSFYADGPKIWEGESFPVRFKVNLLHKLDAKTAVPVLELKGKLTLFEGIKDNRWSGFFRGSPAKFDPRDGEVIVEAIKAAEAHPVKREFDERKYWRRPKTYQSEKLGSVTVPEEEEKRTVPDSQAEKTTHEEIQWLLLKLGSDLGLDVWVAKNDRNRGFGGVNFGDMPRLRKELPRQFDDATNKTIELIDVLWLQRDAIVAAFEVEHTTAIYSGLLRMSDLVSMQPNIKLDLYLVAPDDRRDKVVSEINRPTFARLKPPLPRICKFIAYSELKKKVEQVSGVVRYLKPDFINEIAESCESENA